MAQPTLNLLSEEDENHIEERKALAKTRATVAKEICQKLGIEDINTIAKKFFKTLQLHDQMMEAAIDYYDSVAVYQIAKFSGCSIDVLKKLLENIAISFEAISVYGRDTEIFSNKIIVEISPYKIEIDSDLDIDVAYVTILDKEIYSANGVELISVVTGAKLSDALIAKLRNLDIILDTENIKEFIAANATIESVILARIFYRFETYVTKKIPDEYFQIV
jgi:hypothetical protein